MKEDTKGYEVLWTLRAKKNLDKVIDYLEKEWSEEVANKFLEHVSIYVGQLETYPELAELSKKKGIRRGLLHKRTAILYKVYPRKKEIIIVNVLGTAQMK